MEKYAVEESHEKTAAVIIKNGVRVCPICVTPIKEPDVHILFCEKCGTKPFE